MGRKKKDIYEDSEREGTTIEDFVIPQKIDAFIEAYQPVDVERLATQVFDETRLRTFFKAYPCSLGDPLTVYLTRLEQAGYNMQVSLMNEPAIFVSEKKIGGLAMLENL